MRDPYKDLLEEAKDELEELKKHCEGLSNALQYYADTDWRLKAIFPSPVIAKNALEKK